MTTINKPTLPVSRQLLLLAGVPFLVLLALSSAQGVQAQDEAAQAAEEAELKAAYDEALRALVNYNRGGRCDFRYHLAGTRFVSITSETED